MKLNQVARRNDPNGLTIEHGQAFYYLGSWKTPRTDRFAPLWNAASSARAAVGNLLDRLDTIRGNERLSDIAQAEDAKKAAIEALSELGDQQRALNAEAERMHAERLKLSAIPPGDAAQAVVDVALADHFRSLSAAEREQATAVMVSGADQRMVEACLRLPAVLFGITPELRAVVESNAVARANPEAVSELRQRGEAARTAQMVLNKCVSIVAEHSALTLEERMTGLGADAWRSHVREGAPDAMAALARRYGVEKTAA